MKSLNVSKAFESYLVFGPMGAWAEIIATSVTDASISYNVLLWLIHPLSISFVAWGLLILELPAYLHYKNGYTIRYDEEAVNDTN